MEIALLRTLPIGGCVEISANVDGGVDRLVVLRKTVDSFSGYDDADATVVADDDIEVSDQIRLFPGILDYDGVTEGTTFYYKPYGYHATRAAWLTGSSTAITPTATAELIGPDPLETIRERIEKGLIVEIAGSRLKPKSGAIDVLTAPPQVDRTTWPVVSVHLDADQSSERGLGEFSGSDWFATEDDEWEEGEGWLSRWTLSIVGWCLNPDERISLRKAIKKIVMGNLPVLEQIGIITPELGMKDNEDFSTYGFPVYTTTGNLSCLAPAWLAGRTHAIDVVEVEETTTETILEYP